ncbi:MAG TPA: hypothetical protein VEL82_06315 [Thermoplasmata archaeon]|nr:hypothetical protein [Thermoplasmata archaeon]
MASPRAVRIPRSRGVAEAAGAPGPGVVASEATVPAPGAEIRRNRAGRQRAIRIATIYLLALVALYLFFVGLDRIAPGGSSATAATGLLYFSAIAAGLALAGLYVTLSPAPRTIEVSASAVTVVEWTGRRREFPPLENLRVAVRRRFPPSFLASEPVEAVELTVGRRQFTYQVAEGLLSTGR